MCIVCAEISKGLISKKQLDRNLREMADTIELKHLFEVVKKLEEYEEESKP